MNIEIVIPKEYLYDGMESERSKVVKTFKAENYVAQKGQFIYMAINSKLTECIVLDTEDLICDDNSINRIVYVVAIDKSIRYCHK